MSAIGMLAFWFIGMTLINRVMEGAFIASADVDWLNALLVFRMVDVWGMFSLPIPNLDFIFVALPRLIQWDYSFFGGNAAIVQYFLYAVSAALAAMLFFATIGAAFNFFTRTR